MNKVPLHHIIMDIEREGMSPVSSYWGDKLPKSSFMHFFLEETRSTLLYTSPSWRATEYKPCSVYDFMRLLGGRQFECAQIYSRALALLFMWTLGAWCFRWKFSQEVRSHTCGREICLDLPNSDPYILGCLLYRFKKFPGYLYNEETMFLSNFCHSSSPCFLSLYCSFV